MPRAASKQSHRGKAHEQDDGESIVGQDIVPHLVEGLRFVQRDLRVDGVDCGGDAFGHGRWIFGGPHANGRRGQGICQKGMVISGFSSRKPRLRTLW